MKKLLLVALAATLAAPVLADETAAAKPATEVQPVENQNKGVIWPAFFAIAEWPQTPDIVGIRLTIPFSTRQESVTGIDLGLWGRSKDFEGFQVNVIRNDVKDTFGGFQVGLYNSVNRGDLFSIQAGLWNEAQSFRGLQIGLVNTSGDAQGFQIGIINRTETMYGFQLGLINVIRDAELPMMPFINIGF
jgi:hypothetical protein